jgi:hypothetical protein
MQRDRHWGLGLLRSSFARLVVGVIGLGICYMLAVPPNGGVDEQDHLVRAAATVRGDLVGRGYSKPGDQVRVYDVDIEFKGPHNVCWARNPAQDASCMDYTRIPGEVPWALNGYYPPTYFALVGWPSLVITGYSAVRPIRMVSAAVCLALACFGLHMTRRRYGDRGALLAAAAITPTTFFLFGTVNPHAVEVAGAFAVWASLPAVLLRTARRWERWAMAAAGLLLVSVRPLGSPFWFVILGVAAVVCGLTDPVRSLVSERTIVVVSAVAAAVTVASLALGVSSLENEQYARQVTWRETIGASLRDQLTWFHDAVGRLGWLDIAPPALTVWVWSTLLAAALVVALLGPPRVRLALGLLAGAYLALQLYTSHSQAVQNGLNWQGRYGLALLIGLVTLALAALGRRLDGARWVFVLAPALAAAQLASFYLALRRWTVGTDGPIWYAFDANWSPPLPTWFVLLGAVAATGLIGSAAIGARRAVEVA